MNFEFITHFPSNDEVLACAAVASWLMVVVWVTSQPLSAPEHNALMNVYDGLGATTALPEMDQTVSEFFFFKVATTTLCVLASTCRQIVLARV